jgi:hypothetical protein
MTKNEMLKKLLEQSGYVATNETDEDGYVICKSKDETNN